MSKLSDFKVGYFFFKKEVTSFFGSLTGYIVISIFLIANSLFLWVFPGEYNVLDSGYANLDTLFFMAPWIFLFLVPAVTMRLFADEKRTGTIELLFTRPLSELQIVLAKYSAGIALVLFSLIPVLLFFITVGFLGDPAWNIDTGAFWGSFIGLFFLAAVYVAIGVFASSVTDNQIIAFLTAMIISFFFYIGFEAVSNLELWGNFSNTVDKLGINAHYKSMSRGVLDTRDIIYFVTVSLIFLLSTKAVLEKSR
ncbi:MAG: gliding motility-associated ABC transporter permease subunit GldF [Bacteroidales bacterium]|nr:gliding motility-associated ABC transporter permease subunit GldF [Bacteroidales bacterium]